MMAGSSPGTSLIVSVTTFAGPQAAASRPPLMRDRCLRTQFISPMCGARFEQLLVDALLVGQRQAFGRQREQRRAAAGDQAQHQVVGREALRQRQDALRPPQPGLVRHRMRGLDDLDALRQSLGPRRNVVIARDDQARQRRIGRPQGLHRLRHRAAGLAGAQHQRAALGRRRQVGRRAVQRQGARTADR